MFQGFRAVFIIGRLRLPSRVTPGSHPLHRRLSTHNGNANAKVGRLKLAQAEAAKQKIAAEAKLTAAKQELAAAESKLATLKQELAASKQELAAAKESGDEDIIALARATSASVAAGVSSAQAGVASAQSLVDACVELVVKQMKATGNMIEKKTRGSGNNAKEILNKMIGSRSGSNFVYQPDRAHGGHIVAEYFTFEDRLSEASRVVEELEKRCAARERCKQLIGGEPNDKVVNPLIAVPGSPGSGKSTFFAHFPHSTAFRNFIGTRSSGNPIISTLTFNSGMGGGPESLGIRVLYGAVRAMGLSTISWDDFSKDLQDLEVVEAVQLLRRVLGHDRPVLVLVDELSKAQEYARTAMSQLGKLLDSDGNAHVVVSALSPSYVVDLLSGSQRPIAYVVLPPLTSSLGQRECEKWAESFIEPKTDPYIANLLRSAYLLASGHPRSLEFLVQAFTVPNISNWNMVEEAVRGSSVPTVLTALVSGTSRAAPNMAYALNSQELELVLSAQLIEVSRANAPMAAEFRSLLEVGAVFVSRQEGHNFAAAVSGASIVKMIESLPARYMEHLGPRGQAAKVLFSNLEAKIIADWWERCVDLTIICRSIDGSQLTNVLGIKINGSIEGDRRRLTVRKADNIEDLKVAKDNELVVSPPGHKGHDSRVMVADCCFYNQMKIDQPKKHPTEMWARAIFHVIKEHREYFPDLELERVHITFYEWGNDGSSTMSKRDVLAVLAGLENQRESGPIASEYVQKHWENVHEVARPRLQNWLVPSLISIPRLVTALGWADPFELSRPEYAPTGTAPAP